MKTLIVGDSEIYYDDEDESVVNQYRWCIHSKRENKYAMATVYGVGKKNIRMHRLVLGITDPNVSIDHKDKNGLNNCKDNLRICTSSQNQQNKRPRKNTSSQYKGVCFRKDKSRWQAYIDINKSRKHLGYHDTEEQAAVAYNVAAVDLFGEFASINEVTL